MSHTHEHPHSQTRILVAADTGSGWHVHEEHELPQHYTQLLGHDSCGWQWEAHANLGGNVNLCSFDIGVILYLDIILPAVTLHNTFFGIDTQKFTQHFTTQTTCFPTPKNPFVRANFAVVPSCQPHSHLYRLVFDIVFSRTPQQYLTLVSATCYTHTHTLL